MSRHQRLNKAGAVDPVIIPSVVSPTEPPSSVELSLPPLLPTPVAPNEELGDVGGEREITAAEIASLKANLCPEHPVYFDGMLRFKQPLIKFRKCTRDDIEAMNKYQQALKLKGAASILKDSSAINEKSSIATVSHVSSCTCQKCRIKKERQKQSKLTAPPKLFFKLNNSGIQLLKSVLYKNGFNHTSKDNWNILWTSTHLKSYSFLGLNKFQKINQFPRSYEITRKDSLLKNIKKMEHLYGRKHFDFVPPTYLLPQESAALRAEMERNPDVAWIVKPATSACGRGIFVTKYWSELPHDGLAESYVVVQYINNPLLVDGLKFDLRLYVVVTSYCPLRVYLYEEGMARFATQKYDPDPKYFRHQFMHLTNYSINKLSKAFDDNDQDDAGTKWTLTALRNKLKLIGIDDSIVFKKIDDLVIKTLLSIEDQVKKSMDMFVKFSMSNCFELFGFDVLVDETLKPWLLEVNFSPSLNVDSDIDMRIKSSLISDTFNLVGICPFDMSSKPKASPVIGGSDNVFNHSTTAQAKKGKGRGRSNSFSAAEKGRMSDGSGSANPLTSSSGDRKSGGADGLLVTPAPPPAMVDAASEEYTAEQRWVLSESEDEYNRRGKFHRIFPTHNAYLYKPFFQEERLMNTFLADYYFRKESFGLGGVVGKKEIASAQRRIKKEFSLLVAKEDDILMTQSDVFKKDSSVVKRSSGGDIQPRYLK